MKTNITTKLSVVLIFILFVAIYSCNGNSDKSSNADSTANNEEYVPANASAKDIGFGPIKSVELGTIDETKVNLGKELFEAKCTACHKLTDERLVGPGLKDVTNRREPEWIMNQILDPVTNVEKDSIAKALFETYLVQMTNQNVTEDQARNILEFFRQNDATK